MISVFDIFSIGLGPSSSHTVGPMRAAAEFAETLDKLGRTELVRRVRVDLFGSLAATGEGHGTLIASAVGLENVRPESVEPDDYTRIAARIRKDRVLHLGGRHEIAFSLDDDVVLRPLTVLPRHPNALRFTAYDEMGLELACDTYFSVGGGFIVREGAEEPAGVDGPQKGEHTPDCFTSGDDLLERCERLDLSISEVMLRQELTFSTEEQVRLGLKRIHEVMNDCVERSVREEGNLPGGLNVRRRAKKWHDDLVTEDPDHEPGMAIEWVNLIALAVNEENAAGGRVVTAPTNGAAGIIPAVLYYAMTYIPWIEVAPQEERDQAAAEFLLTAAAIGLLFKERASISGAEVGCQGEVGSASAMAAAGLAELLGGTPLQVENAAEIAMEHNLGLTCDPIGGLVQIPCIERNAIAAVKAINAARMAMRGDGRHHVSLDQVIETMRQTGADMSHKYKETALGGLAVNVPLC
ncbi:L-serine ammonia-lyase [Kineosporia sp. NBRC 101731]|uniref:L-serine ammonia-lyase n=1 Tax=Kineosporia sp. NBRC 101731 TaxID=3032199 RepID=UPI0024A0D630|nr:L-serine ammonia-lyase [Kineosporia sp. NBRC 101731]GLY31982.1 L-serine ammonia-lyase [Kineosporia sp. NBRC 101731]